ncbi:Holliday junction recognition protein isoform X1 [Pogona vitticeps]
MEGRAVPPGSPFRGTCEDGDSSMDRRLRRSSRHFASAMSSIVEKYNFPFDDDLIVSIKSLTYNTSDGPRAWGEESSTECTDTSYQSFEEEQFTDSLGTNQLDAVADHKSSAKLASIKRHLENIHIKENIPLICYSETPVKNKYRVQMDMLLDDGTNSVPEVLTITGTRARNAHQWSPLQELDDNSSIRGDPDVLGKRVPSTNEPPTTLSLQLPISVASNSASVELESSALWGGNENGFSSFLEMYESADEHCSWNNVTIADLYPGMVKALSKLLHKASSSSLIKRYKYGYWHPKKTKLNTTTERIRKYRLLKSKSSLTTKKEDQKRHKLPLLVDGSSSFFDNGKHQCSANNITRTLSSICCIPDSMEIDSCGMAEDTSYTEKVRQGGMKTTIIPSGVSTGETFLVQTPMCICLPTDFVRKGQTSEKCCPTDCTMDSEKCNVTTEDNPEEISTMTFNTTSRLSLSLNSSMKSYLQKNESSPVKMSIRLLGNSEIKMLSAAVSLQRRHSFSSLPVNRRPANVHQSCEDAFEKMYKELCSPKLQKSFKFSNICKSPRKSAELHTSGFSTSSKFNERPNDAFESIYQKLCSEGFPKIPIFLRAANLKKKYEGVHMSETVNALVNSPLRTVPAVARTKRAANFSKEDFQPSPIKRLKNIPENSYRICQKMPSWKSINLQKTDKTFTSYTPNINNWPSDVNSGFSFSSSNNFLTASRTDMKESRIADVDDNCLYSCISLGKSQNYNKDFQKSQL